MSISEANEAPKRSRTIVTERLITNPNSVPAPDC